MSIMISYLRCYIRKRIDNWFIHCFTMRKGVHCMNLLWGIGGVIGVLAIAFLLSSNRKAINWRTILIALALQMSFSFIVLRWDAGKEV